MITSSQQQHFVFYLDPVTGSYRQDIQSAFPQQNGHNFSTYVPAISAYRAAVDPVVHNMHPAEAAPLVRMTDDLPDRNSSNKKEIKQTPLLARMFGCWCPSVSVDGAGQPDGRVYYQDFNRNSIRRHSSMRYGSQTSPFAIHPACIHEEASTSSPFGIISPFHLTNGLPSPNSSRYTSSRHGSWHKPTTETVSDTITLHHQSQTQLAITVSVRRSVSTNLSEAPTDWTDARSHFTNEQEGADDVAPLKDVDNETQQMEFISRKSSVPQVLSMKLSWIPDPPLHFADRPLQFVPVPAVTGFAAYWSKIPERTTPFPQPIDIMIKANWLVRQIHKSIPGFWIRETAQRLNVISNPVSLPGRYRAYREVYDKTNESTPTWSPRRDLMLGHCSGEIFYTADGWMILRASAWTWPGNKVQFITEDYLHLEENGQVCVNEMWCLEVDTGRTASQLMAGTKQLHPPKGWA